MTFGRPDLEILLKETLETHKHLERWSSSSESGRERKDVVSRRELQLPRLHQQQQETLRQERRRITNPLIHHITFLIFKRRRVRQLVG